MHEPGKPLAFVGLLLIKKVCVSLSFHFSLSSTQRCFSPIPSTNASFPLDERLPRCLWTRSPARVVCIFPINSSCPTTPRKVKPSGRSSSRFCQRRNLPSIVSRPWITCASFHSPPSPSNFDVLVSNRADILSFSLSSLPSRFRLWRFTIPQIIPTYSTHLAKPAVPTSSSSALRPVKPVARSA